MNISIFAVTCTCIVYMYIMLSQQVKCDTRIHIGNSETNTVYHFNEIHTIQMCLEM